MAEKATLKLPKEKTLVEAAVPDPRTELLFKLMNSSFPRAGETNISQSTGKTPFTSPFDEQGVLRPTLVGYYHNNQIKMARNPNPTTMFHEYGHAAGDLDLDQAKRVAFAKIYGDEIKRYSEQIIRKIGTREESKIIEHLPEPLLRYHPGETFAQSFAMYYQDPEGLKKVSPKIFSFIDSLAKGK